MKKITFYGISISLLMMASSLAFAGHLVNPQYDFGADAMGNEFGALSITSPDIKDRWGSNNVTASAPSLFGNYYAYLDDKNGANNEGGLGVCQQLGIDNSCFNGGDDSIEEGEILKLSFNQSITLSEIEFHDGNHNYNGFIGDVDISIDNGAFVSYGLTHILQAGLTGTEFLFRNSNSGGSARSDFYVTALNTSTTPIPAAVWLFVSGLGSLGFFRRKKKKMTIMAA